MKNKIVAGLAMNIFLFGMMCTAYGATFIKDYDYSGTNHDETYIQVNTDFANPSNPVGVMDPLVITSNDFTDFNISDGSFFNIKVWQRGNYNNTSHEQWGLYFDNDTTTGSGYQLVQLFSYSMTTEDPWWVLDTMPGSFDLSGSNWAFKVDDYSSAADHAGIKIDDVIISNVPLPGALWLLGSGLVCLASISRKKMIPK